MWMVQQKSRSSSKNVPEVKCTSPALRRYYEEDMLTWAYQQSSWLSKKTLHQYGHSADWLCSMDTHILQNSQWHRQIIFLGKKKPVIQQCLVHHVVGVQILPYWPLSKSLTWYMITGICKSRPSLGFMAWQGLHSAVVCSVIWFGLQLSVCLCWHLMPLCVALL